MLQWRIENNKADWVKVREEVFMKEQGFKNEFEPLDDTALHITFYTPENELVGCLRTYSEEEGVYILGRVAILPSHRKMGYSKEMIQQAEIQVKQLGAKVMKLHAQCYAQGLYEKLGYIAYGAVELDEHVEHIWMQKIL